MTKFAPELAALSHEDVSHRAALALIAGGMSTFEWHMESDRVECDAELRKLFGFGAGQIHGANILDQVHPDDAPLVNGALQNMLDHDVDYDVAFRVVLSSGDLRWIGGRGRVVERDQAGQAVRMLGVNWDMTQAKDQEERLGHLVREMNHRVNNAFALVESMLMLGGRNASSVQSFAEMISTQIHALADAHQLASDFFLHRAGNEKNLIDLDLVIQKIMRSWTQGPVRKRLHVVVEPGLFVEVRDVTPLAMILYELATNAVKHSVLGREKGSLSLMISTLDDSRAELDWVEILATPRLEAPSQHSFAGGSGFGAQLTKHCLAKMKAELTHHEIDFTGHRTRLEFKIYQPREQG